MAEITQVDVLDFMRTTDGRVNLQYIRTEMSIAPKAWPSLRTIMTRLAKESGEVERIGGREGWYRYIDHNLEEMNWQQANENAVLGLKWPFQMEKYVNLYPSNLAVVAGTSNSGKTALCNNFMVMNMDKFCIDLYCSDAGSEQFKSRMEPFEIDNPAPFKVFTRHANFSDIINKDHISIVDYLEYVEEVFEIKQELERLYRKLEGGKGMALVAIQKKFDQRTFKGAVIKQDLGYGGATTIARASLYLTMNAGSLKITKAKSWADPTINPNNMAWTFKLVKGAHFVNSQSDIEPEQIPF